MNLQRDIFDPQVELDFDPESLTRDQVLREVAKSIVREILRGKTGKWEMPWSKTAGYPVNARTGRPFHGRNLLILWGSASRNDFRSNRWATFYQWRQLGATVQKAEKATKIFKGFEKDTVNDKDEKESEIIFRSYSIFNADQVSYRNPGQGQLFPDKPAFDETRTRELVALCRANIIHGGTRAFYNKAIDRITMPPRSSFVGSTSSGADEGYYQTLLHELVHWTGHESRCARDMSGRKGDESYAFEELVAEIGSAMLCQTLGISPEVRDDHIFYIQSWKRHLNSDPKYLITAAVQAKQAVDHLQGYGGRLFL